MRQRVAWHVLVVLVACAAASGTVVASDQGEEALRPINWRIAGPIARNVQAERDGLLEIVSLIFLKARGAPGPGDIVVATGGGGPVAPTGVCPDGTDLEVEIGFGEFVATLEDLSTIWTVLDDSPGAARSLCIDFDSGAKVGIFDYVVTGGTGRFAGASGACRVELDAYSVGPSITAEDGIIVGWIEVP